ncbi:class I adenylate-forming enzyme family protein [Sedimentitalea todarodis]|uniref:Class I adenylate-forming enzyme family protein n=1 Tax=Sedimentitalea todarodis TaxID=1631240 RepID=A0ABU3VAD9_9RHOB|nr:class I adenylate-forming enzyme family protein [Sedimentitalea todarodis]MDU9003139.1 class I adenylate-forming enzyme family protein [Sedimentitalea todarodis]
MTPRWHSFLDAQVAERPDAPALADTTGIHWTYGALGAACDALKQRLAEAGVQSGDRVLILSENCASAVAALFACSRLGATAIPVNARLTAAEIDHIADHAGPAAVLLTSEVSPDAAAHATRMGAQQINGAFGVLHLATPYPSAPDDDPDLAVILYTTGTTGAPKGVMLTHGNLVFAGKASVVVRDMRDDDVIYGVLPITHVFGLASIVTAVSCAGAFIRFEPRFSAAKLYEALNKGVTLLSAVPQMHALLMQYTRVQGHETLAGSSLRVVTSGAAPLDPAWKRKAEAFYGVALQNGYGMTETTAGVCVTMNEFGDPDISTGPVLPGVQIDIDENVPGGGDGAGEVLVRGPVVMKGYYRNPEATAAVLGPDGWLRTGDLGRIDTRNHLHIIGRTKELIIHGGFNVYPPEVEAALNDHPQVIQCAVVGRSVGGDEQVLAFVQAAENDWPDVDELRAFAAERLAGYKRPALIIVATSLPAAPTGKVLKHRLVAHFSADLAD